MSLGFEPDHKNSWIDDLWDFNYDSSRWGCFFYGAFFIAFIVLLILL